MTTQNKTRMDSTHELEEMERYVRYMTTHTHNKYSDISEYKAGELDLNVLVLKRKELNINAHINVICGHVFLIEHKPSW